MDSVQRNRLQGRSTELAALIVFVLEVAQFENAINTGFFVWIELFWWDLRTIMDGNICRI